MSKAQKIECVRGLKGLKLIESEFHSGKYLIPLDICTKVCMFTIKPIEVQKPTMYIIELKKLETIF